MKVRFHDFGRDPMYKIWNKVDGNMILFIHSAGGSIVFQDVIYPMKRGTLCFLGNDKLHYTMPDKPWEYDRSKIVLPERTVYDILATVNQQTPFRKLFSENSAVLAVIPETMHSQVEQIYAAADAAWKAQAPERVVCCFFQLMVYLKEYAVDHLPTPSDPMSKAIAYINNNYAQPISLDSLCEQMHMSKYYFCRKFKSTMGMTVMDYVLNTRITTACKLLADQDLGIGEIAAQCGFSSASYFCQIFRKTMGVTASQYQKQQK